MPSLLRGFSAPVRLAIDLDEDDLLVLFAHDSDPFNRWQAAQTLSRPRLLSQRVDGVTAPAECRRSTPRFVGRARRRCSRSSPIDPAFARPGPGAAERSRHRARDRPRRRSRRDPAPRASACARDRSAGSGGRLARRLRRPRVERRPTSRRRQRRPPRASQCRARPLAPPATRDDGASLAQRSSPTPTT